MTTFLLQQRAKNGVPIDQAKVPCWWLRFSPNFGTQNFVNFFGWRKEFATCQKASKNHSFGANFIRKVKHVTKRSSLFTVNYWELLNHNLQKTKQHLLHLLRADKSLEQGEHPPSTVVAGTDKRAVLQHSVTCPARWEVMKPCGPKAVGPPW